MKNKKQLGIYIHIPFCMQKCAYCDFLSAPADETTQQKYINALVSEIIKTAEAIKNTKSEGSYKSHMDDFIVKTVFFGGGTPSAVSHTHIKRILDTIKEHFNLDEFAEITIECNPGTLDDEKAFAYRECGINRISFGLQSAVDSELVMLGRIHDLKAFETSFNTARKYGFNNINVDIMSAIPGQTVKDFEHTINSVIAYRPEHISAYSLIVEDGTRLGDNLTEFPPLPDEEAEREMYYLTQKLLKKAGYNQYEISNYSKNGYECQHNLSYWERKDYLGFGIGAASLFDEVRFSNCIDINNYIKCKGIPEAIRENVENMTLNDRMEEFMFLGLRKLEGISEEEFVQLFGKTLTEVYKDIIDKNIEKGLLKKDGHHYRLTAYGLDISNTVMSDFIL